ncbi:hypothetical protein MHEL_40300 [Mycolicibacterium helvum]|uniref:Uncharacterized protein n=1 Tax=Mycolicibacterium helvum TaxID=1534349 RepID=A0A7I7T939_9MYCO|nr:hypothetical protein MHEL_40300 [Mycolicibacterium helvum]
MKTTSGTNGIGVVGCAGIAGAASKISCPDTSLLHSMSLNITDRRARSPVDTLRLKPGEAVGRSVTVTESLFNSE